MRVEEEYPDVLQNIEMAVMAAFRDEPALIDLHVLDAIEALIRRYTCEEQGRGSSKRRLLPRAQRVHDAVLQICEWRLGRAPFNSGEAHGEAGAAPLSVSVILLCLKRLKSSIRLWSDQGGRQGYLNYIREFLPLA